jgi:hypothetical protein
MCLVHRFRQGIHTFFYCIFEWRGGDSAEHQKKTSEFVNAVNYLGMMEQQCVDIDVVAIIKDRCMKMELDAKRFQMNTKTELTIINKTVNIYNDPYHLYKSFCKLVIQGDTDISQEILHQFFADSLDTQTMDTRTYIKSFNNSNEYNLTIFSILNHLNLKNKNEKKLFNTLSAFYEFFKSSISKIK